jgi:hypothetical protein
MLQILVIKLNVRSGISHKLLGSNSVASVSYVVMIIILGYRIFGLSGALKAIEHLQGGVGKSMLDTCRVV